MTKGYLSGWQGGGLFLADSGTSAEWTCISIMKELRQIEVSDECNFPVSPYYTKKEK